MSKYGYGLLILILGVFAVVAINRVTAQRNQVNEVQNTVESAKADKEKSDENEIVQRIGIFPPGFEAEIPQVLATYENYWGVGRTETRNYKGYSLIVPPSGETLLVAAEREVDSIIDSQKYHIPSLKQQRADRNAISTLFGTDDQIKYNEFVGKYTDTNGYQYVVEDGIVISKSIGVTPDLQNKWLIRVAQLEKPSGLLADTNIQNLADEIVHRVASKGSKLHSVGKIVASTDQQIALDYGNIQLLIDRSTGEIINFNHYLNNKEEFVK
ncbi:MAG TPA: hypothetical protein VF644_19765 [Pyrinomonadaceae bacterium]|jgi:hypothetical protein